MTWAALGVSAAIAVAWAVFVDLVAAAASVHPIALLLALAPVTTLALAAWTTLRRTEPKASWLFGGALALSVLVVLVPWNERKRFVLDVYAVRAGMSVDDVEAAMHGYTKGPGANWCPPEGPDPLVRGPDEAEDPVAADEARLAFGAYTAPDYPLGAARARFTATMTYRWSETGAFNADWGQVRFVNGKVVDVAFLPD